MIDLRPGVKRYPNQLSKQLLTSGLDFNWVEPLAGLTCFQMLKHRATKGIAWDP